MNFTETEKYVKDNFTKNLSFMLNSLYDVQKKKNCDHFFSDGKEPDMCDFGSVGIGRKKPTKIIQS